MGDSITEGTLVEFKAAGTFVSMDDVVAVLETDKVSVEVRAPASGVVVDFMASLDDVVAVGAPLFKLDTTATAGAPAAVPKAAAAVPSAPKPAAAAPKPAAPAAAPAAVAAAAKQTAAAPSSASHVSGSVLSGSSAVYVDAMYASWQADPLSVHASWRAYFTQVDNGKTSARARTPFVYVCYCVS